MTICAVQLQSILQQQREQLEQSMQRLIEYLTETLHLPSTTVTSSDKSMSVDSIAAAVFDFHYEPSSGHKFDAWFKHWEETFQSEFPSKGSNWKTPLLVRKLGTVEHEWFTNFILPQQPKDLGFDQTLKQLRDIFGEQLSLFNVRYNCLKLTKRESHDYVTFAGLVNWDCERFQLKSLTEGQFKCLIFIADLHSPRDADIQTRLLSKLEQDKEITVKALTAECQRLVNLKRDTAMIQQVA
ncbi:hypothetical protein PHET_12170 [Paragonimus heterotremus]|uniref:DUF7083 domain-containing protein n=1 Tax=Paragonimus heterotremus TaxID=100268 RepID=A0A8J4WDA6_9TREM|nr:hypothetical protein PHET_12170 [Paragonimus heterotremus]